MSRSLPVLLLLLAACGGRIEAVPGTCPPPDVCSQPGWIPKGRGAYLCEGGQIAYVCCGYTAAELARLRGEGDEYALRCEADE